MTDIGGAKQSYWKLLAKAVGLGLFTGLFGNVYLIGIDVLTDLIWGEDWANEGWFSGDLWTLLVPVAGGVAVGLLYRLLDLPPRFPGFIEDLDKGEVEPKTAPGVLAVAVLTLISGPSLGPEAPMGTAGGAAGTWLARRSNGDAQTVRRMSFIGISGAFGGCCRRPSVALFSRSSWSTSRRATTTSRIWFPEWWRARSPLG